MNDSDCKTETSSLYCETEMTTAKKYDEPLITTEETKESGREQKLEEQEEQEEPAVIKQAREEVLRQLEEARGLFIKLQVEMQDEAKYYEAILEQEGEEIIKAQRTVEEERTRLD